MRPRIGVSGPVRPDSGIGVIQRELYPRLRRDCELVTSPSRDGFHGRLATPRGVLAGLRPPDHDVDGYVAMVSPLPLRIPQPLVYIVHDLRWLRAGSAKRHYRNWDLTRAVRAADLLVCVSECTRADLIDTHPHAAAKTSVAWLGPGVVSTADWSRGIPGRALLVGADPRKQNEQAARVIAALPVGMVRSVAAVGVSDECYEVCVTAVGAENVRRLSRISDAAMAREFSDAEYYVHLGGDEGFGLPYIESLTAGAIPVVLDQPLTREVLADSAIRLRQVAVEEMAREWAGAEPPAAHLRRTRAERFSWETLDSAVRTGLGLAPPV